MTDLHTHILPGIDDGARDPASARELLEREALMGVDKIALTSHFHLESEPLQSFLDRREAAFAALSEVCPAGLQLKRGCEVFFSPQLLCVEAAQLCLEGTNVLLLELPVLHRPAFLTEVLTGLARQGIVPLIAHAERYAYVAGEPSMLERWRELGALIQINAASVTDGRGIGMRLIRWGLADVLASDAHSLAYRPPILRQGLDAVARTLGPEKARELERNAGRIFAGNAVPERQIHVPRKILGIWI